MKRRDFITLIGATVPNVMLPRSINAQASRARPLVVWLGTFPPKKLDHRTAFEVFAEGMEERGYVKGRNLDLMLNTADGVLDRLPVVVEQVIQLKPDVIMVPATLEAVAARKATSTIPIVCGALADAVHLGLIASEARPGGNVTGIGLGAIATLTSPSALRVVWRLVVRSDPAPALPWVRVRPWPAPDP